MRTIDSFTQLCAVIGNPVEHSLSPAMHNAAFEALNLNYVYLAFRVEDVANCIAGMRALLSFRGMSVTIPHKLAVMQYLDEIDPIARRIGCVNTITRENGILIGSNTDGLGTLRAFQEAGVSLEGKKVLFLGAGGAVRAVAFAFAEKGQVGHITILGRTISKVEKLVQDIRKQTDIPVYSGNLSTDLPKAMAEHEVIVQGTPVGMYPHSEESCVPLELLRADHIVFDMVYRPLTTRFIREAQAAGCKTIFGIEMLLYQAALQFEKWTGYPAPIGVMREAALNCLQTS
ncbi:MAG TPA: shikimate dehydrogenase [Candidatus Hydrogenedentes bacterium]|nr:shikimate dehydrogenase [Candidatus Hydrogenedentota bacterium]HOL77688.1 shikimate dehydrogenase [Candidatus Hydrogenedentota bacterium]HPO86811.1 shikimate dehydrogenase [Candidatus Hydrogenedentota bacterium]